MSDLRPRWRGVIDLAFLALLGVVVVVVILEVAP